MTLGHQKIKVFQLDFLPIILTIHHGVKDNWSELKFFCDWAFLMKNQGENINWDRTLEIAKKYEITDYLIKSCAILHQLFGVDLPSKLMSKISKFDNSKQVKITIRDLENKGESVRGSLTYRVFLRFINSSFPIKRKIISRLLSLFLIETKIASAKILGNKAKKT